MGGQESDKEKHYEVENPGQFVRALELSESVLLYVDGRLKGQPNAPQFDQQVFEGRILFIVGFLHDETVTSRSDDTSVLSVHVFKKS